MSDFSSTIGRFVLSYSMTRFGAQSFTDGKRNANPGTTSALSAAIFPAAGRDLQRLAEGTRASDVIQVFTTTTLICLDEVPGQPADHVHYKGKTYQVEHEDDWGDQGNFKKYIARKVPTT